MNQTKEAIVRLRKAGAYLYLVPAILLLLVFMYYPIINNFIYSFLKWDLFKGTKTFIGLKNYSDLLHDGAFFVALMNNIRYVLISLFFQVGVALIFAAVIEQFRYKFVAAFYRTVLFIPTLISLTVIGLLFSFVYKTDGLLNSFLQVIGLGHLTKGWLGNADTAIYSVIAVSQWKSIGYTMMLLCVAIQRIPNEIYEAAIIDGATKLRRFKDVTVPLISDMIAISVVINISGGLLVFNEIYVMTNGGPYGSSEVLSTLMYKNAFVHGKVGYASAIAIVILLLSVFFFALQSLIERRGDAE